MTVRQVYRKLRALERDVRRQTKTSAKETQRLAKLAAAL